MVTMKQPRMVFGYETPIEKQLAREYDTEHVRDSTKLFFELMGQQADEPPNGRYSHLLGRWYSS